MKTKPTYVNIIAELESASEVWREGSVGFFNLKKLIEQVKQLPCLQQQKECVGLMLIFSLEALDKLCKESVLNKRTTGFKQKAIGFIKDLLKLYSQIGDETPLKSLTI